jgi:outer membrane protein TolC
VDKERAAMTYEETRRQVESDVREACYSVEKAAIQLKGAQLEQEYRNKDVIIARQKERLNLIEPAQRLQAEATCAEAQNALEEAVAFYKVAMASLEKAVGVPLDSIVRAR